MSAPPRSDTRPIRGVVTVALGGKAVQCCVCHCGQHLTGSPARCGYCRTFYSENEIAAARATFTSPQTDVAA